MKKLLKITFLFLIILSCARQQQSDGKFVSLSPSITKQIIDLSSENLLSGITSFCPSIEDVNIVGTLVNPNIERILLLKPKKVLMSLEDSAVQKTEALKKSGIDIHIFSKNKNFEDICKNYLELAKILKAESTAKEKLKQYKLNFESLKSTGSEPAVFLVSTNPLIAVSGKSYIGDILRNSGYKNEFEDLSIPYPVVSMEALLKSSPKFIFVMEKADFDYLKRHSAMSMFSSRIYYTGNENPPYYTLFDYLETMKILNSFRVQE